MWYIHPQTRTSRSGRRVNTPPPETRTAELSEQINAALREHGQAILIRRTDGTLHVLDGDQYEVREREPDVSGSERSHD